MLRKWLLRLWNAIGDEFLPPGYQRALIMERLHRVDISLDDTLPMAPVDADDDDTEPLRPVC